MSRIVGLLGAVGLVAVLAVIVAVMASGTPKPTGKDSFSMPSAAAGPTVVHSPTATPTATAIPTVVATAVPSAAPTAVVTAAPAAAPKATAAPTKAPTVVPAPAAPPVAAGQALPLTLSTGDATQVITVKAASTGSTIATVQAWNKSGNGWVSWLGPITAHIGSQGMTTAPSESKSATPMGSFTLTQAFGNKANPGTALPYHAVAACDYWISDTSSALYNTMQCGAYKDPPNEHLSSIWQYGYAVNIDYNTYPATKGAGSAFFLHITDGGSTAGCVAIPQGNLVSILQWLNPAGHPRILIGTR